MLDVFLEVVLPVAVAALFGGVLGRWRGIPVEPAAALTFYIFAPALVFHAMSTTTLSAHDSFEVVAVLLSSFAAMYGAAWLWSLLRRHDAPMRAAVAVGATTPNVGNMGLPVSQLAFGDLGLQIAVMNFVAGAVLVNTAGIAIAATAGGSRRDALLAPLKYPALYAALAGVAVNVSGIDLPTAIDAPASSLGAAAVPTMLVVLGLQLSTLRAGEDAVDTVAVNVARLLISPAAAWLCAEALDIEGVTRGTLIVLAAMPTAVSAIILATTFNARPVFVTQVVVTSTLLSMVTLSVLIALVR
ncbi:MAG TPA: AEC family transporter [Dehalococcoidia bacterium]|nr:AEC family transporter [Dehalococcoidia bacterium]